LLPCNHFFKCLLCLQIILFLNNQAIGQNYIFAQLNGTPLNTTGWNLQGDARVTNVTGTGNSELRVCSVAGGSGAVFYNQPINLSMCNRWKAEFDFRMFDGTGADGLAFCFLDVPPTGFVGGGGMGIPSTANGLKICFDTWNNCIPFNSATVHQDMPKIEIRWGSGYNECVTQPTRDNADGKLSFIRSGNYNHAKITYDNGNIQVFVNDSLFLSGYQQFNFSGYLGFTASIGGYTDNHSIKNVVIYTEMPPSNAGNALSFCPNDTVQIGGPSNQAYAYTWYPSTGLSDASASDPLLHLTNDSSNSQLYKYYVRTSFSNRPGCASIDSVAIRVYPNPKVHFITPEICLNDAIAHFSDSTFTNDNTTLPFLYQWNFGDPNANIGNPNTSVIQNPSHTYSAASNYLIGLKVTNSKGCSDSLSKIFTVNGAVPKAAFNISNTAGLCSNQDVEITNQCSVDFGSITKVQIFWGDTSTVSYTDDYPFQGKAYYHKYPDPVTTGISNYTIRMIAYSGISCGNVLTKQINILPSPKIQFSPIASACDNSSPVNITQAAQVPGMQGNFSYFGTGLSASGILDPKVAGAGTDSIFYKYIASNNCVDSGYETITIIPSPTVNAGPDLYVLQNEKTLIDATASGTNLVYKWYPPTYLNYDTILKPYCIPVSDIFYTLTATGSGGCSNSSQVSVKILPNPLIPNAFSPNGDGINDYWGIKYLGLYPHCDVRIFNRFGQLIFHSIGYNQPWDGTYKGHLLPTGVYCYIIDTKKQKNLFTGIVTLIR
jgi:gliding motility-associated-like protein